MVNNTYRNCLHEVSLDKHCDACRHLYASLDKYSEMRAQNEKLREALRDCVNVMSGYLDKVVPRDGSHLLIKPWKKAKTVLGDK